MSVTLSELAAALRDEERKQSARDARRKVRQDMAARKKAAAKAAKALLNPVPTVDQIRKSSNQLKRGWAQ